MVISLAMYLTYFSAQFEIPMWTTSNLQIWYLKVIEKYKTYDPLRWIRYITHSNSFVVHLS
jgi:AP-4 complex subunit mu-1